MLFRCTRTRDDGIIQESRRTVYRNWCHTLVSNLPLAGPFVSTTLRNPAGGIFVASEIKKEATVQQFPAIAAAIGKT
jgi:hypothetical protein